MSFRRLSAQPGSSALAPIERHRKAPLVTTGRLARFADSEPQRLLPITNPIALLTAVATGSRPGNALQNSRHSVTAAATGSAAKRHRARQAIEHSLRPPLRILSHKFRTSRSPPRQLSLRIQQLARKRARALPTRPANAGCSIVVPAGIVDEAPKAKTRQRSLLAMIRMPEL